MVKILASVDFINKIILDFQDFTISDFEKSSEINIESYLFFKKIITENKAHIYLNISEDKIEQYKLSENEIDETEKDIAFVIKSLRNNKLFSDAKLYESLLHCKVIDIPISDLPCFLLLDNVNEEICKKIELHYGINCFSLKRLKVEDKYRIPVPYEIDNTKEALFNIVNSYNYHTMELFDQFFSTNMSTNIDNDSNTIFLNRIKLCGNKKGSLAIHTSSKILNFTNTEFERRKNIFINHFNSFKNDNNSNLDLQITTEGEHDRFVLTNTTINMIGNSFNKNTPTYINVFPKIIYNDYYS